MYAKRFLSLVHNKVHQERLAACQGSPSSHFIRALFLELKTELAQFCFPMFSYAVWMDGVVLDVKMLAHSTDKHNRMHRENNGQCILTIIFQQKILRCNPRI